MIIKFFGDLNMVLTYIAQPDDIPIGCQLLQNLEDTPPNWAVDGLSIHSPFHSPQYPAFGVVAINMVKHHL